MNYLEGRIIQSFVDGCFIKVGEDTVRCVSNRAIGKSGKVRIAFRPEVIELTTTLLPGQNREGDLLLSGDVIEQEFIGDIIRGKVRISKEATVMIKILPRFMLRLDQRVYLRIPGEFIQIFASSPSRPQHDDGEVSTNQPSTEQLE